MNGWVRLLRVIVAATPAIIKGVSMGYSATMVSRLFVDFSKLNIRNSFLYQTVMFV